MSDAQDRVQGILLGLVAGDRNGGPTQMAVRLAESVAEFGEFHKHDVAARYLNWWREGAYDTGPTTGRVLALVDSGLTFDEASERVHQQFDRRTAGCNPPHRSAPLAMIPFSNSRRLARYAREEAALTHRHFSAGQVSAISVVLCHELARGADWESALQLALNVSSMEGTIRQSLIPRSLKRGGFAPDVLTAAIHFVSLHEEFAAALEAALQFAGPANYCPVLVGSVGGARWGASQITDNMLDHCEILPRVRSVATALASQWH